MAKTQVKPQIVTQNQFPVVTGPVTRPSFIQKYSEADAGKGYSAKAEDSLVPMIRILQSLSPELKPNNDKYIRGAEVGDILLKSALEPLVKAEKGIVVQPCAFEHCWVEWTPRSKGGGFVARYPLNARPETIERPNPENPTKTKLYVKATGNELLDTRYHYVLVDGRPFVIPFSSTGHTVSREWTQLIKNLGLGPAWERKYRLMPKLRTKMENEWYVFSIDVLRDANLVPIYVETEEEYLAGRAFHDAIVSGEKTAEADEVNQEAESNTVPF